MENDYQWTVNSTWNHLQTMWQAQPLDLLRLIYEETHHQNRESVLFIGTQFNNLYTAVDTPAKGRGGVCVVFVFACKYVLGHSRVSQPPNSGYASSGTLAFSLRRMPPRPATDDALTHTGSSAAT